MAELESEPMKSGPEATSLLGTREWTRPARPTGRPRALTSMEKRRWLCRRNRMPGDGGLGSSPPSVGEKVLGSGWASLPRGPSCRSERKRHQLPSLPLCLGGKSPSSLCPPPRPAVTVWGCGVWGVVSVAEGKEGLWGECPHPHCPGCGAG